MPDGTVYYGEVAWQPKDGASEALYYSLEDVPVGTTTAEGEHEKPESKVNMIRHGYGI